MKKILFVVALLFLLVGTINVSAFWKNTHKLDIVESLKIPQETEIYKACARRPDLCMSGNILTDFTVYWYYSRFVLYKITHTPVSCTKLIDAAKNEDELSCAAGSCTHQAADIIAHNELVPNCIRSSKITNEIIHAPCEQKVDLWVDDNYAEINFDSLTSVESYQTCKPLFLRVLAADDKFFGEDVDDTLDQFIAEVQEADEKTGYDVSYFSFFILPTSVSLIIIFVILFFGFMAALLYLKRLRFKDRRTLINWVTFFGFTILFLLLSFLSVQFMRGNAFDTFSSITAPISRIVPLGASEKYYVDKSIEATKTLFKEGEKVLFGTDASGRSLVEGVPGSLDLANQDVMVWQWVFLLIIVGLFVYIIYKNFKPKKAKTKEFRGL